MTTLRMTSAKAFTLIELIVVIGIITVLAALLLGGVARAKEKSRGIHCLSNLKQWGTALFLYTADNEDYTPRRGQGIQPVVVIDRPEDWFNALPPLLGLQKYEALVAGGRIPEPNETTIFSCPRAQRGNHANFLSYAMNMYLSPWIRPQPHRYAEIPRPASLAFMADGPCAYSSTVPSINPYSVQARHAGRANIALLDGHVESFNGDRIGCGKGQPSPELGDLRWQTEKAGINPQGPWLLKDESRYAEEVTDFARSKQAYVVLGRIPILTGKMQVEGLEILVEDDPVMRRPFIVMEANPKKIRSANVDGARALSNFLLSPLIQDFLLQFGTNVYGGRPLFFPVAR